MFKTILKVMLLIICIFIMLMFVLMLYACLKAAHEADQRLTELHETLDSVEDLKK